jgi:hypothetical protein
VQSVSEEPMSDTHTHRNLVTLSVLKYPPPHLLPIFIDINCTEIMELLIAYL